MSSQPKNTVIELADGFVRVSRQAGTAHAISLTIKCGPTEVIVVLNDAARQALRDALDFEKVVPRSTLEILDLFKCEALEMSQELWEKNTWLERSRGSFVFELRFQGNTSFPANLWTMQIKHRMFEHVWTFDDLTIDERSYLDAVVERLGGTRDALRGSRYTTKSAVWSATKEEIERAPDFMKTADRDPFIDAVHKSRN